MLGYIAGFFTYETTKSVVVKSWLVGIINRFAQLLIVLYFIGWVFVHEKAYQVRDTGIESAVMTKVKGFGFYNDSLMDVADYVAPQQGASVFCIITKMIITPNQSQGFCGEPDKKFKCTMDEDCTKHLSSNLASGRITGKCLTSVQQCQIEGWCPAENDNQILTPMREVENFTIFIKNSIRFPLFNVTRGNILPSINNKRLTNCLYHPVHDPFCPIFRVGDVLQNAEDLDNIMNKGGEIVVNIAWQCNLDFDVDYCLPSYTFTRLDTSSTKVSQGYNFRFAKYYRLQNKDVRTLHKAFAIRFDIIVSGNAGKFSLIPTIINVVAACTSVGLATVLCDIILLNFLKGAEQYKAKKFEEVSDSAFRTDSKKLYQETRITIKAEEKNSDDSGAFSIGYQL
ncbi:P2X purinoceptor 3a [Brachyhypopomus gauderio]|uniref:P2X purinoceptor 3a n=1 Tax=Brachyhypopomus gauderio TaxID=698409 RepID=UPI0040419970